MAERGDPIRGGGGAKVCAMVFDDRVRWLSSLTLSSFIFFIILDHIIIILLLSILRLRLLGSSKDPRALA